MSLENYDQTDDEQTSDDTRNASTGPRTPEGKAVSSQNATKHGCRSKTLILRHEDPAEYEALHKNWSDHYQPEDHAAVTLVGQLIDNHWFLLRATKRMEQIDSGMPEDPFEWTADHHKMINMFTRYKTAAERAFHKSLRAVETTIRDRTRAEMDCLKADLMRAKIEAQIARKAAAERPAPEKPTRPRIPLPETHARTAETSLYIESVDRACAVGLPELEWVKPQRQL
ncbi:MAG: hypothetical protein WA324_10100 [Bryobacteraceae bacterium]